MTLAPDLGPRPLRLVPAPTHEPPFDDEHSHLALVRPAQPMLPLDFPLPGGLPGTPRPTLQVLVGRSSTARSAPDDFGPVPTTTSALPRPGPWAARLVQAVAEVLALDRPVSQLARWATADVYDAVRFMVDRQRRHAATVRAARPRPAVRSVHVTEPADGVAEVCAVVADGDGRSRAYALRLEGVDGRWRATALDLV